ncbi:MAG TPA: chemotaxis protein CheW [Cyanophyceae cyanobacterium]
MSNPLSVSKSLLPTIETSSIASLPSSSTSEQFLRFHLLPNTTALLPIEQMTEVLTIPRGQIVPIFHMPPWVMGAYNWRGEILWMIDLGHLVGLTPWHQQTTNISTYTAVVLQTNSSRRKGTNVKSEMLGVIVNRVEDIEWCSPDWIQSPPSSTVTPELVPFLRGYWLKSNGDMLVLLDGNAIIAAMPKE